MTQMKKAGSYQGHFDEVEHGLARAERWPCLLEGLGFRLWTQKVEVFNPIP
jgi:hypothetical protein